MIKRVSAVLLVVIMLASLVGATSAQGSWNTGIDVQNLGGTDGSLVVTFYNADGTEAGSLSDNISGWGSLNFYLPGETSLGTGQFSAVVSSDVPVAAATSIWNYDFGGADIYLGTLTPENDLSFPLVYRNHTSGNWTTKLTVQNASGSTQNVELNLFNAGESTAAVTTDVDIPAYAAHTFDITDAAFAAFGPYGSATVSGSAPLAGVADNLRDPGAQLNSIETSYRAFGSSQQGQNVIAPLVYKNFNLWTSGVNILNTAGVATTVNITYTNANPAVTGGPWYDSLTLGANAMDVFYTPANGTGLPDNFYGSAELSSTDSDIIVVVASQRYRSDGAQGVAYEGSLPSEATACVSLPVVHNRTTWKTGINLFNLGGVDASVEINYASSNPSTPDAYQTITIPAGEPLTVYMPSDGTTALGFYGAADVKSTNSQPLLVNVANSRMDRGVGSNFVGVNYTCP